MNRVAKSSAAAVGFASAAGLSVEVRQTVVSQGENSNSNFPDSPSYSEVGVELVTLTRVGTASYARGSKPGNHES